MQIELNMENALSNFVRDFALVSPDLNVGYLRHLIEKSIAVRLFIEPKVILTSITCWQCREVISAMCIMSQNTALLAHMTHSFTPQGIRPMSTLDPITSEIVLCEDARLHVPMYASHITDIQTGFIAWIEATIARSPTLRRKHSHWKYAKKIAGHSTVAQYCNICPCCETVLQDEHLLRYPQSPFFPGNSKSDSIDVISPDSSRPLFIQSALVPLEDLMTEHIE